MKRFILGAVLTAAGLAPLAAAPAAVVAEHGDAATRAAVVATIDTWRAAVVRGDRQALDRLYHDDLSYGHSDGAVENKASQIARSFVPGRAFTAVDVADLAVRSYGNVAYVTAVYTFHVRQDSGAESASRLPSLDVWTRSGKGWQLIARQLARSPQ